MSHAKTPRNGENRVRLEQEEFLFKTYNPEPRRDNIRAGIACGLIVLLTGMIGYAMWTTHGDYARTKELLTQIFPAILGLVGSAIGFYFGGQDRRR